MELDELVTWIRSNLADVQAFDEFVLQVWTEAVAPALQELEELIAENSALRALRDTALDDVSLVGKTAAAGLALAHIGAVDLEPLVAGFLPAAVVTAAKALHSRRAKLRQLRRSSYFFCI